MSHARAEPKKPSSSSVEENSKERGEHTSFSSTREHGLLRAVGPVVGMGADGQEAQVGHGSQPKLRMSQPYDKEEKEADRVAGAVMGGTRAEPAANGGETRNSQRNGNSGRNHHVDGETARQIELLTRSGGEQMPESTRSFFESRFGRDFGDVRVHTGPLSIRAARDLDARSFT